MPVRSPWQKLEDALADGSDVYVHEGVNEQAYFTEIADSIRAHRCEPHQVRAVVMPPGFPDAKVGEEIVGLCLAKKPGYWLVYQSQEDRFCCFWGSSPEHLGAHGVFGSPMYCWTA